MKVLYFFLLQEIYIETRIFKPYIFITKYAIYLFSFLNLGPIYGVCAMAISVTFL